MTDFKLTDIFLPYQRDFFISKKKRKVLLSARQVGKSFTIAASLVYKALSKPGAVSLCVSTGARAAAEIIAKCKQFSEAVKVMTHGQIAYESGYDHIRFSNGSRVMSLPANCDALRGFTASCVAIDEAAFVWHLDDVLQAIGPTLSRDPEAELILASTPAGMNGKFFEMWEQAICSDEWYSSKITILDAKAAGLKVDIDSLRSLCPDEDAWNQEYMCEFSKTFGQFVSPDDVVFEDPPQSSQAYFSLGMDVGRKHDNSAITVLKTIGEITWVEDVVMLKGLPYAEQLNELRRLHAKYAFTSGQIDATGIGSAFAEQVHNEISPKFNGMAFTGANKTPMHEAVRAAIFSKKLRFSPKSRDLVLDDFSNVHRIVDENGNVRFRASRNEQGHSDFTSALVLGYDSAMTNRKSFQQPKPIIRQSAFGGWGSRLR